jgi:hypothetical protein
VLALHTLSQKQIPPSEAAIINFLGWNEVQCAAVFAHKNDLRFVQTRNTVTVPYVFVEAPRLLLSQEAEDARDATSTAPQSVAANFTIFVKEDSKLFHSIFMRIHALFHSRYFDDFAEEN